MESLHQKYSYCIQLHVYCEIWIHGILLFLLVYIYYENKCINILHLYWTRNTSCIFPRTRYLFKKLFQEDFLLYLVLLLYQNLIASNRWAFYSHILRWWNSVCECGCYMDMIISLVHCRCFHVYCIPTKAKPLFMLSHIEVAYIELWLYWDWCISILTVCYGTSLILNFWFSPHSTGWFD